jgi:hypothetical protein
MASELIKTINAFVKDPHAKGSNTEQRELLEAAQSLVANLESPTDYLAKIAMSVLCAPKQSCTLLIANSTSSQSTSSSLN